MGRREVTIAGLLARTRTTENGCMEWEGHLRHGYAQLTIRGHPWGSDHRVHRLVKQLEAGRKFAPEELVLHRCDNKCCINPEHLYVGTAKDNTRDIYERGAPYDATGAEWPEASKKAHSAARQGPGNPFYGRKHSEETKAKMREAQATRRRNEDQD